MSLASYLPVNISRPLRWLLHWIWLLSCFVFFQCPRHWFGDVRHVRGMLLRQIFSKQLDFLVLWSDQERRDSYRHSASWRCWYPSSTLSCWWSKLSWSTTTIITITTTTTTTIMITTITMKTWIWMEERCSGIDNNISAFKIIITWHTGFFKISSRQVHKCLP